MTVATSAPPEGPQRTTPEISVLLVEDDPGFAVLVRRRLERQGTMAVRTATTLAEAVAALAEGRVDCVLLDLSLPDADGMTGVQVLREEQPDLPVVVLTGNRDDSLPLLALAAGAQDYLSKDVAEPEVLERAVRYAIERKRHENEIAALALHDPLTGLPNRRLFFDRLEQALARSPRSGETVGVVYLDVDRFKAVNDTYGHRIGDALLVHVAACLRSVVRPGDTVARLAGDEFAILVERVEDEEDLRRLGERLISVARRPFTTGVIELRATFSVGIALGRSPLSPDEVLSRADAALYAAKRNGRDQFHVAADQPDDPGTLAGELPDAVRGTPFELHAQDVVRLRDGAVTGRELLLRWRHPDRGLLKPAAFLEAAERTGLIVDLGRWVLIEALRMLEEAPGSAGTLAVNVSGTQVRDETLVRIAEEARRRGVDTGRLIVEVSEGAVVADPDHVRPLLDGFRAAGAQIAIDDVGAAGAPLRYLADTPADVLKLDRALLAGIDADERARVTVTAIVELARTLGLRTVAEGVETPGEREALTELGCDDAQGFLWDRPHAPVAPPP
jgi:diguanylate cyclase (GGDEF)-like protein